MPTILSTVADFKHIIHPLQTSNLPRKPSIANRIMGIICLILTVPFTFGILTGLYFYWAKRKVALIDKSRTEKVDQVVSQVFGKVVSAGAKPVSREEKLVSEAASSLLSGKTRQTAQHLNSLKAEGQLTPPIKAALLEMAIINNQINTLEELKNQFVSEEFPIENFPLHKARSGEMVEELIRIGVPVMTPVDERQRTALHYASNVEVARALIKKGAELWPADENGLVPLNTVTNAEVLKEIVSETQKRDNIPPDRVEYQFLEAFNISTAAFKRSIEELELTSEENEPKKKMDIGHLMNNIEALLGCISREKIGEEDCLDVAIRAGSPELLYLLIDHGAAINPPAERDSPFAMAMHHLFHLIEYPSPLPSDKILKKILNVIEIVKILIDKEADVNRKAPGGSRPLDYICLGIGDPELLRKLIEHHVELTPNSAGNTPLEIIMDTLFKKLYMRSAPSIEPTPFLEKRIENLSKCVRILLDAGVSVKLGEMKEYKMVEDAILYNLSHEIVNDFVNKGITLNIEGEKLLLETALDRYMAISSQDPQNHQIDNLKEIIKILIKGGAKTSPDLLSRCAKTGDPDIASLFGDPEKI